MRVKNILCVVFIVVACACQPATRLTPAPTTPPISTVQPAPTLSPIPPTAVPPTFTPTQAPTTPTVELTAFLQFDNKIHLIDFVTGKDAAGFPPIEAQGIPIYSDDGKIFAAVATRDQTCEPSGSGTSCYLAADLLIIFKLELQRTLTMPFPPGGQIGHMTFSPDGSQLALAYDLPKSSTIMLVNVRTAELITQRTIEFRPWLLKFASDGKTLGVYGTEKDLESRTAPPRPPRVLLLDAETLQEEWAHELGGIIHGSWCIENCQGPHENQLSESWYPAVISSKDGRAFYIVHADADQLTTVNFAARTIRTSAIETARGPIDKFLAFFADTVEAKGGFRGTHKNALLSSDGTRLYVGGIKEDATRDAQQRWNTSYDALDLQMIDAQSGHKLANRVLMQPEDVSEYFGTVNLSPDGKHVIVLRSAGGNWRTDVFTSDNLDPVARLDGSRVLIARRMDGEPILLAHKPDSRLLQLGVLDPHTFQITHMVTLDAPDYWINP